MSLSLVIGPLTPDEISRAIATLTAAGIGLGTGMQTAPQGANAPPPRAATPAMPPMPAAAVAPPPAPAVPPTPANPRLQTVLALMDAYSKAGHGVAGARKVLAQCQLNRAQDANEEQLIWLEQAFANTAWAPA